MLNLEYIRTLSSGEIRISEPLARLTSFRVGGPVDIYVEPLNTEELQRLRGYFREHELSVIILGNGSNILVSDEGYRGAAIGIERGFSDMTLTGDVVTAGAGSRLSTFVEFCIGHGFAGTEMLAGIPGTLGGAVIMNAGAYGGTISDHLVDITVLRGDEIVTVARESCGFRYRGTALQGDIVLSARFALPRGDVEQMRTTRKQLLLKRKDTQPVGYPNAGSIFKNPEGQFAAKLIQDCGLKGHRVGGAEVSEQHANFIINTGDATAAEIVEVIDHVRRTVRERTGIDLELEIQLIGFSEENGS